MKKIMILGASILQLPAIVRAKELGYQVIAVDRNPEAVGFREEGILREVISTNDTERVLEAAQRHKIDGILTICTDFPIRTVAHVARVLGLPGISEEVAFRATDKNAMRQVLRKHGVPIPAFFGVSTIEDLLSAVDQLPNDDYIIKPADSSGSRGVHLLHRGDEYLPAYMDSLFFSHSGTVMVEEFMIGPEVSVEAITSNGRTEIIAITDKQIVGNGNFTEIGHSQPSALTPEIQGEIAQVVRRAVAAIGIDHSPSHTELKVTPTGVKVVEIGARLGGDNITTHLVPLSTGVDMVEAVICIALGQTPDIMRKQEKGAAIRYCKKPTQGLIKEVRGLEEAKGVEGVVQVTVVHGVGEIAQELRGSGDRLAFVIAQGDTAVAAVHRCEAALERIEFVTEDGAG